ncbi:lipoprotein LpqH [Mycobacterium vicinigordonae]|uniref:Lipoprotein LpqH n=1 Tax=Mycobacterium vicinigordonae TaxID=1719132 RepID=A0A7D6HXB0_9MYCO|nr:lipoprotein LpqH [Mycobacterium vicinigordonae]QLL09832.1 lipoprotein LpqH [Mycobacterium vicinigordonae]
MQRHNLAAVSVLLMSVAGCSSEPIAAKPPTGTLLAGTAQVTMNGTTTIPIHEVECQSVANGFTVIEIGTGPGITVLLGSDTQTPKSLTFNDFDGFSGGYWQNLEGSAQFGMVAQTYTFTGSAVGFGTKEPHTRTTNDFTVKVAC